MNSVYKFCIVVLFSLDCFANGINLNSRALTDVKVNLNVDRVERIYKENKNQGMRNVRMDVQSFKDDFAKDLSGIYLNIGAVIPDTSFRTGFIHTGSVTYLDQEKKPTNDTSDVSLFASLGYKGLVGDKFGLYYAVNFGFFKIADRQTGSYTSIDGALAGTRLDGDYQMTLNGIYFGMLSVGFHVNQKFALYPMFGLGMGDFVGKIHDATMENNNIARQQLDQDSNLVSGQNFGLLYGIGAEVLFDKFSIFANVVQFDHERNMSLHSETQDVYQDFNTFMVLLGFSIKLI